MRWELLVEINIRWKFSGLGMQEKMMVSASTWENGENVFLVDFKR